MADRTARILIQIDAEAEGARAELDQFSARMDALTAEFERFGAAGEVVGEKIASGHDVQASEVDDLIERYVSLTTAVREAFPDDAPEKLTSAMRIAKEQIATLADSVRDVPPEVEKIAPAAEQARDGIAEIKPEVDKIPDALTRAEQAVAKFNNKLQTEADVSQGELENIWRSQMLLNEAIQRGEINLRELGEEGVKRLKAVRAAANDAEQEFVRLERAVDQQAAKTRLASGDVGAAGTAMFGSFSKVAGVLGVVIGLVVQFKDKLVDVANWLGLRGDKVQAWLDGFSARAQVILRSSFDTLKNLLEAAGTILDGVVSRDVATIKQGLSDLENASQKTLDGLVVGFSGTNAQVEEFAKRLGITTAAAERNKGALDSAAEAAKRLAEEKAKLKAQVDEVTRSLQKEMAELEKQQAIAGSTEWKAFDSGGQLSAAELQVRQLEQSVEQLRQKLAEQIASWGEDSAGAKRAAAELEQYEAMLDRARVRAEQLAETTEQYREEQERASEAARESKERVDDLKERQGALTEELTKLTGATETGTEATRQWTSEVTGHVEVMADGSKKYVIGQAAMRQASAESMAAVEAAMETDKAAADAKKESASATEKAASAVEQMAAKVNATNFGPFLGQLDEVDKRLDAIVVKAERVFAAIEKMTLAGGAEEASKIDVRRSGSSTSLGKGDKLGGGFKGVQL